MGEHVHDCIVVGAGPAGSAAALQMARDGLDVVLLERGVRPGDKNVMSGVLLTHILAALVPDFASRAPLERRITGGYETYILGNGEVLHLPSLRSYRTEHIPHPPYTIFRAQFDAWFAAEAEAAGAELFTETVVEDLVWEEGRVAGVHTRRGDLRARVVIGADGVNSAVAEKSGLLDPPTPDVLSLIVREVLDLPAERIEERFNLRPGEGLLCLFLGVVSGRDRQKGTYYTELYTNQDSLSLTVEAPLEVLQTCGVTTYEVLAERERHPYIASLIQGSTLREYQAHLIPYGGVADLGQLYGDGVLLAGDAGRFTTKDGVGSWTAMASGVAAARAVKRAIDQGDLTKAGLEPYLDFLDKEGLIQTQREAREDWLGRDILREIMLNNPERLFEIGHRFSDEYIVGDGDHPYSVWGDLYHELIKPVAPWYLRWPLGLVAWLDTRRWRSEQNKRAGRHARG